VKGLPSKVRSSYQQGREPTLEGSDSKSKSSEQRNVSKLLSLSCAVRCQSFVGELVEFTLPSILFDLAIPNLSVKFKKPFAEGGKFRWRETLNFLFDILDLTHGDLPIANFIRVSNPGLTPRVSRAAFIASAPPVCSSKPLRGRF